MGHFQLPACTQVERGGRGPVSGEGEKARGKPPPLNTAYISYYRNMDDTIAIIQLLFLSPSEKYQRLMKLKIILRNTI